MAKQVAAIVMEGLEKSGRLLPVHDTQDAGASESDESNTGDSHLDAGASRATPLYSQKTRDAGAPKLVNIDFSDSEESSDDDTVHNRGEGSVNYDCVSSPLGADLPKKIKRKFFNHEYVNLAEMLSPSENVESAFEFKDVKGGNTFKIMSQPSKREIYNIDQWTDSFTVYVSVLCENEPKQSPGLWKYCKFIRATSKRFGGKIWKNYDEKFRRQMNQHKLPWGQVHWDLYFSLATPGQSDNGQKQSFRAKKPKDNHFTKGQCFTFENTGACSKNACKFKHACLHCNRKHQSNKCNQQANQSKAAPNTNSRT